ncbi:hypothetical protein COO60DRAFT_1529772 [Scenedesmus sp. NREL 46B-D3]|nr:hypothetical protein COO60DRAFT_1529772 [Scenedesmus sp. NREL 46B-D3]
MSQMLEQLRWPPDPWVVGEFPNRRSHSFGSAGMGHVHAAALAAHPTRPLYVSGSSTGRIYLWQFGDATCKAAYVPITSSQLQSAPRRLALHEAVTTPHWGSPAALRFSRSGGRFGAVGEGGLVGLWRQDFISAVDGLGHAEWVGRCLSRAGTALTFLGDTGSQVLVGGVDDRGGAVVLVDTLAPPSSARAAQLLSPRGTTPSALTLVPGGAGASGAAPGAVLVVGDDAGELRGFDVRLLSEARPLWSVKPHTAAGLPAAAVTCVACWDPGMVGGSSGMSASGGGGGGSDCTSYSGSAAAFLPRSWLGDLVVSGGRDGSIAVVNAHTGTTLQLLQLAHYTERRGLLERVVGSSASRAGGASLEDGGPLLRVRPASAVAAAVTDVAATGEGLVSVGADGVARFHPLAHLLNHWAGDNDY